MEIKTAGIAIKQAKKAAYFPCREEKFKEMKKQRNLSSYAAPDKL